MIDLYTISVLIFYAIIALFIFKDRKKIERHYFVVFMRRTKRFRNLIDNIAKLSPKFWKIVYTTGVFICLLAMLQGVHMVLFTVYNVFIGNVSEPALQLVLPSITSSVVNVPGVIAIPFWFWLITIAIILIPHELSHGIAARAEKIKLKSVGVMLAAIFLGAFVEPDEDQLKKKKMWTKLRVFAAGSFANLLIAVIILIIGISVWNNSITQGITILELNETAPAYDIGIQPGMVIKKIGDKKVGVNFYDYSFSIFKLPESTTSNVTKYMAGILFFNALKDHSVGDKIAIETDKGSFDITLTESPYFKDFPYMGVVGDIEFSNPNYFFTLFPLLAFMFTLSFAVAIVNILPIYPLDGGLMLEAVTDKYFKKKSSKIIKTVSTIIILLLVYSLVGPLFT